MKVDHLPVRTAEDLSEANERQVGLWEVVGAALRCETTTGPVTDQGCVQYAEAGRVFFLPLAAVLGGRSMADDTPALWEYEVRGNPVPVMAMRSEGEVQPTRGAGGNAGLGGDSARYVQVDGDLVEVSPDIRDNYPEAEWVRLMRCRVRFGLS